MFQVESLNYYTNNREWDIIEKRSKRRKVKYACCPEEYPEVTFTFFLQRNAPGYRSLVVLPCLGKPEFQLASTGL